MNKKLDSIKYGQWVSRIGSVRMQQEIDNLTFITENLPIFSDVAVDLATKKLAQIRKEQEN
jgi:hypothetical protein